MVKHEKLAVYTLKSISSERMKKGKFSTQNFILNTSSKKRNFFMNMELKSLANHPEYLPIGTVYSAYHKNNYKPLNNIERKVFELIGITKQDKYILINSNCSKTY